MPVHPHARVGHGAIELNRKEAVLGGGGDGEILAVPAGPGDGQRSGVRVDLGIEGAFDGPIMGQWRGGPVGILEIGTFRALGFALEETPAIVEAEAALGGWLDGGGGFRGAGKAGKQQQGG